MKSLWSIWWIALLTICFKIYGFSTRVANNDFSGDYTKDMQSFVGIVFVFALVSIVLLFAWTIGLRKKT